MTRRLLNLRIGLLDIANCTNCPGPLLDWLFGHTKRPKPVTSYSRPVAGISFQSGVDIHGYLEKEIAVHRGIPPRINGIDINHISCERQLIISLGQTSSVCWDWWIDPREPASLLCEEFKAIGHHELHNDVMPIYEPRAHGLNSTGHERKACSYWPYRCIYYCSYWPSLGEETVADANLMTKIILENGWKEDEASRRAAEHLKERYERKMRRKDAKHHKAMGFGKNPKMPGAWIE